MDDTGAGVPQPARGVGRRFRARLRRRRRGTGWAYNGSVWYILGTGITPDLLTVYGTSATNVYVAGVLGVVLLGTP
jgi:hypothetical protein